jgi:hypothetical protein
MAKRTTEQSKRTVRVLAIGGSVVALGGVGVAFAANPHPASTQQPDARLTALQQREDTLARQAKVVNQQHDAAWREYRAALTERTAEIDDVNAWNAEVRANAATAAQTAPSSSYSGASPSAGYVYTPPVASSGAS